MLWHHHVSAVVMSVGLATAAIADASRSVLYSQWFLYRLGPFTRVLLISIPA